MDFTDRPYVFVFYELTYKKQSANRKEIEQNWAYYLKEFINYYLKQQYPESLTFQIESNQILSFAFLEESGYPALKELIGRMKQILDFDKDDGYVTIAISSFYTNAAQMTDAYKETLQLSKRRRLNDETQIIESHHKLELAPMSLSPQQEQEFDVNLRAGNKAETLQIVHRFLAQLHKRSVSALQYYHFADEIVYKTIKTLTALQADHHCLGEEAWLREQVAGCHTYEQLSSFLDGFLASAIELVGRKKGERDPITSFVIEYVEKHYSGDVTLEIVADKLNISSGYLSTYFKEKTGVNFIDYLNDLRIRKAKEMLLESGCRIQDVARKAGYQNMNSFNRMFKKFCGITPSEFRKQVAP
ncbi:helix-turn-helix domain-containing protein [Gordoniibacillus kamchatkensis]